MLNFYESTSKFIQNSYSKWTERDPQIIQDAVGGFLKGVGNMMDASVLTRSKNKVEKEEVRAVLLIVHSLLLRA